MKLILRWLPAMILVGLFGLLWGTAVSGGDQGVVAWLTLMGGLPYLGMFTLLLTFGLLIWKRKLSWNLIVTSLASILIIWPYMWQFGVFPMAYPISLAETNPATAVRLPANEPLLVAWGGDTPDVNYHVTFPDARWAYDFVVEPANSTSKNLEDYGCWGVPVVAPAAGEIVVVHEGEADVPIGEEHTAGTPSEGNHIYMQIAGGTYLAIGHLQQNSIIVSEGDLVAEGEVLGKCGNSGSSSEPHIHLHHQRHDPREVVAPLSEGLPLYFRDHDGTPMPEGGVTWVNGRKLPQGPIVQHIGK
ncbi:MAG: peptidase M24 [Ardenticatenaceae bacterium]|nr:MAG: peptidase M24 [Ardenticatenaceae bacterium]